MTRRRRRSKLFVVETVSEGLPIIERIKKAGKYLGVSMGEIAAELSALAEKGDEKGINALFNTYLDWEARETVGKEANEETLNRSLRNFDIVAKVADHLELTAGNKKAAMISAVEDKKQPTGRTQKFFRDALGFHPQNE